MTTTELQFHNILSAPAMIVLAIGMVGLIIMAYARTFRPYGPSFISLLVGLRLAAIVFLMLCLVKPAWHIVSVNRQPGKTAVVLDTSRSMTLPGTSGTRYQEAARVINDELAGPLGAKSVVEVFDLTGKRMSAIPEVADWTDTSDYASALGEALQRLKADPIAAVVVVGDGMDNSGTKVVERVAELDRPVLCVGDGPDKGEADDKDIGIERVTVATVSRRVRVNNTVIVQVALVNRGSAEMNVPMKIQRGKELIAVKTVNFRADQPRQVVELQFVPDTPGDFVYTAVIYPESKQDRVGNNARNFELRVRKAVINVLYVEGALRWENKFLRRSLVRDPDIALESYTRVGPRIIRTGKAGGEVKSLRGAIFSKKHLENFDVVILGDFEATYFMATELVNLGEFIERQGAGFLLLGGYYGFGEEGFGRSPLAKALPVVSASGGKSQIDTPFQLALTPEGQEHMMFRLERDPQRNLDLWRSLPPLDGCARILRAKKGGTVLAVNPLITTAEGHMPVAVVGRYGRGRSMVLGADTTWRWRMTAVAARGDTHFYDRFWGQVVRWLAGGEKGEDETVLQLATDKYRYQPGENIQIKVALTPPKGSEGAGPIRVSALATVGGGAPVDVPLQPAPGGPNQYVGSFSPEQGGDCTVMALAQQGRKIIESRAAECFVQSTLLELQDTRTNHDLLRQVAERTRGCYFTPADVGKLPAMIKPVDREFREERTEEFWNSPYFFVGFLGCIGMEWFLRKRRRMA